MLEQHLQEHAIWRAQAGGYAGHQRITGDGHGTQPDQLTSVRQSAGALGFAKLKGCMPVHNKQV